MLDVAADILEMKSTTRSLSFIRNVLRIIFHFDPRSGDILKNTFSLNASLTSLRQDLMLPGTLTSLRNKSSTSLSEEEYLQLEQFENDLQCSFSSCRSNYVVHYEDA